MGGTEISFPSGVVTNSQPEGVCQSFRLHGFVPHPQMHEGRNNTQIRAQEHTLMKTLNHALVLYTHSVSGGYFSHQILPSLEMAHLFVSFKNG